MNSTLSPIRSIPTVDGVVKRYSQTTYVRKDTPDHSPRANLPVTIEGNGVEWEGKTEMLTRSSLRMVIEGCPLVILSQSIQFQVRSPQTNLEMVGSVQGITPRGTALEGRWARVQLDVTYESLDDLKWHRLKSILNVASSNASLSHLRGNLIPLDPGESLWKMKPVSCANETSAMVGKVEQVFKQVSQSDGAFAMASNCVENTLRTESVQSIEVEPSNIPIVSTHVEFPNSAGQRIRAYYDAPQSSLPPDSPVMILIPGYGETKREYITLAYYLASNGFHVLRYDHTNHVGESDGEHVHTTLSMMEEDLGTVLHYVEDRWPTSPRGVVATSLSGRVAIKMVANDGKVDFLFLITPIVDVRKTLQAVHQEDLIANYENGNQKGITNVLGFNVELDLWLADAIQGKYSELETTYHDISRIQTPVVVISAEHDSWVGLGATKTMVETLAERLREWVVIPQGLHRVLESPKQARAVYREVVQYAQEEFLPARRDARLQEPARKAIGQQNKIERDRKKVSQLPQELSGFWKDYLDHFHYIVNFSDYQQLLDHMWRLLGPVKSGDKILDAGCGNGNFGSFLHKKEQGKSHQGKTMRRPKFEYIGIDFVPNALRTARNNVQASLVAKNSWNNREENHGVDEAHSFHCVDLNKPLPFKDGTFDKVVSNLVLGYLDSPAKTIQEFMRVLTPGGTLVFTNLKPNSDLSRIFTNFVQETSNTEEIEEAKQLLNNSGKIREAEGEGLFRFPDAEELEELVRSASEKGQVQIFSTFANQAYMVSVTKGLAQEEQSGMPVVKLLKAA